MRGISLIGSESVVADRVQAFEKAGVATINAKPIATTHDERVADIKVLKELTG